MLNIVALLLPLKSISGANAAVPPATQQQTDQVNQKQQDSDRSGSSGAAQAMAAMGAGMAMLGCFQGLKAAQEEPDPAQKQMLRSMAMQQCSQAAQNAASAAQNGDQKKKLDGDSSPQMTATPFEAPQIKTPEDDNKAPDLSKFAQETKTSASDGKEPQSKADPLEKPTAPESTKTATVETKSNPVPELKASKSVPQLISPDTITAKEDSTGNDKNSGSEATRALGSALAGKGSADDLLKKALAENGANPNDSAMIKPSSRGASVRKDGAEFEGGGTSSSNSSSGESNSNSPFDTLLAQMMGGGQPGGVPMTFGGDSDLVYLGKNKDGQPKLNIFQFASTVYSELSRSQNRIAKHPIKAAPPNSRIIGSEPNLVTKALAR